MLLISHCCLVFYNPTTSVLKHLAQMKSATNRQLQTPLNYKSKLRKQNTSGQHYHLLKKGKKKKYLTNYI